MSGRSQWGAFRTLPTHLLPIPREQQRAVGLCTATWFGSHSFSLTQEFCRWRNMTPARQRVLTKSPDPEDRFWVFLTQTKAGSNAPNGAPATCDGTKQDTTLYLETNSTALERETEGATGLIPPLTPFLRAANRLPCPRLKVFMSIWNWLLKNQKDEWIQETSDWRRLGNSCNRYSRIGSELLNWSLGGWRVFT